MQDKTTGFTLLIVSICIVAATQLIIKSRLTHFGAAPVEPGQLVRYAGALLRDAGSWAGGIGLLVGATLWYMSLSRIPLSVAFPTTALSYPLIFTGSIVLLGESASGLLIAGNILVVLGVCIVGLAQIG